MEARTERARTFAVLLAGYGAYYLCRANLGVAMPLLERGLGLDKRALGLVTGVGTLAYAAGKLANGPVADLLGGRRVFFAGLVGAAVANVLFGASAALPLFVTCWALNRFVQSAGWIALVQIVSRRWERTSHGVVMGWLSLSFLVGDVAARGYGAAILSFGLGWRALFFVPAATVLAFAALAWPLMPETPPAPRESGEPEGRPARLRAIARVLGKSRGFWIACALSFLLTFLRTVFLDWSAAFLADRGASGPLAAIESTVFPIGGAAGALFAGFWSDRVSKGRRAPIAAWMLGLLVPVLALLAWRGAESTPIALGCFAAAGVLLLGPYSMLGGCLALDYGGKRAAATAAGVTDGIGYLGASASGLVLGGLVQDHGWRAAFVVLLVAAALSLAVVLALGYVAERDAA